jgi:hypothetical protein
LLVVVDTVWMRPSARTATARIGSGSVASWRHSVLRVSASKITGVRSATASTIPSGRRSSAAMAGHWLVPDDSALAPIACSAVLPDTTSTR